MPNLMDFSHAIQAVISILVIISYIARLANHPLPHLSKYSVPLYNKVVDPYSLKFCIAFENSDDQPATQSLVFWVRLAGLGHWY